MTAYNDDSFVPSPQPSSDAAPPASPDQAQDQHLDQAMLYCPVCSTKLDSRKCKLFCAQCGYYMSCADYY